MKQKHHKAFMLNSLSASKMTTAVTTDLITLLKSIELCRFQVLPSAAPMVRRRPRRQAVSVRRARGSNRTWKSLIESARGKAEMASSYAFQEQVKQSPSKIRFENMRIESHQHFRGECPLQLLHVASSVFSVFHWNVIFAFAEC